MAENRNRISEVLWWGLLLLQLYPVWSVEHLLTQDGPLHFYSAHVFLELWRGESPVIAHLFEFSLHASPNWIGPILFIAAQALTGPLLAEKLVVTLIMVSMAGGYRYLLSGWGCQVLSARFLIFPFLLSHYLVMGLYPFLLGVGCSLFVAGYYFRSREMLRGWKLVWCSVLVTCNYFCHLIPAAITGILLLLVPAAEVLAGKISRRQWLEDTVKVIGTGVPSFLLAVWFLSGGSGEPVAWNLNVREYLHGLVSMSWVTPFTNSPLPWMMLWLVVMTLLGSWMLWQKFKRKGWQTDEIWLALAVLVLVLKVIIPEGPRGGSLISYRLTLFFWMAVSVWFALTGVKALAPRYWYLLVSTVVLVGVCQPIHMAHHMKIVSDTYAECVPAFESIPPHSEAMLFGFNLNGEREGAPVVAPRNQLFTHCYQKAAMLQDDIGVSTHFQAEYDLFPIRFKQREMTGYFAGAYDEAPQDFPLGTYLQAGSKAEHLQVVVLAGQAGHDLPRRSPLSSGLADWAAESRGWETSIGPMEVILLKDPKKKSVP
ncbi:MAG: hypothetical protein AAF649_07750 [Verrucomicrobiota bacterium]